MPDRALWFLAAILPTVAVALLGIRAALTRKDTAWADYRDVAELLAWFVPPLIAVAVPLLATGEKHAGPLPAISGIAAVLAFRVVSSVFTPGKASGLFARLRAILAESGQGLGICGYLAYCALTGSIHLLGPSASLYIAMIWTTLIGQWVACALHGGGYKQRRITSGELFDRIRQIAKGRGVDLESVTVITRAPGRPECINAVAMDETTIIIFSDLIARLNKDEVDAVIEHEVGHLADERIWTIDRALRYGCYLVLIAVMLLAERHIATLPKPWSGLMYLAWVGFFVLPEMLGKWYSRNHERKAIDNVGFLTDPQSAISGHYKLALLNHQPTSRPLWSRLTSSHPCMDESNVRIARRAGLTDEQVEQAYAQAREEVVSSGGEKYELGSIAADSAEDGTDANTVVPVRRSAGWAGCRVMALAVTAGGCFFAACMFVVVFLPPRTATWIAASLILAAFVGSGFIIALPIHFATVNRRRATSAKIIERLTATYGETLVSGSLLVDALFPERADADEPWQGALLSVSDGRLHLRGEVSELAMPLDRPVHVSYFVNQSSSGAEAKMVLIADREGEVPRSIFVRPLEDPGHSTPRDAKSLCEQIRAMFVQSDAELVSRGEIMSRDCVGFGWSTRVPTAALIYVAILLLADYLARTFSHSGLGGRFTWCAIATSFTGPGLWAWVTRDHKPDSERSACSDEIESAEPPQR